MQEKAKDRSKRGKVRKKEEREKEKQRKGRMERPLDRNGKEER